MTQRRSPTRSRQLAVLLRGIDPLFMNWDAAAFEMVALVAGHSQEELWARRFLSRDKLLAYSAPKLVNQPYPSTEAILHNSNIAAILKRHGISALMLSCPCTAAIHHWARRHRFTLVTTPFQQQQRFENKLWFDRFLTRSNIPKPQGAVMTLNGSLEWPLSPPVVVQKAQSMGGEGTYVLASFDECRHFHRHCNIAADERLLVREFINGTPLGITVFVVPGIVALSAIRRQCYYAPLQPGGSQVFAGVQWLPHARISATLHRRLNAVFGRLGKVLYRRRFLGFANVDFIVDDRERIYLIECNPRLSAATPQLFAKPQLLSDLPAAPMFLEQFTRQPRFSRFCKLHRVPRSEYDGSTLDITFVPKAPNASGKVVRAYPSGSYSLRRGRIAYNGPDVRKSNGADSFCLFSFAQPGQLCAGETTLATVIAHFPLYDATGALNHTARRLLNHFQYVTNTTNHPT
jgi:hypothetical protein